MLAINIIIEIIAFNTFFTFSIFLLFLTFSSNQFMIFSCLLKNIAIVKTYKGVCPTIIQITNASVTINRLLFCVASVINPKNEGSEIAHKENNSPKINIPFFINLIKISSFFFSFS